jgi:UDP-GlcNAc:undecaprenyl-phosphate/decaprenyl-phosphate GlcNAc-1-phosphate transferase
MGNPFSPLVISLLISIALGYPAMLLAKQFHLIDIPGSALHKIHARPTPLAGGILIAATLVIMAAVFRQWLSREVLVILAGAAVVFIFGVWDDIKGLSALPKLIGQLIAAAILISLGVQVRFMVIFSLAGFISPMAAQLLNILITLFWLIGITNALNMIDSMDGIVAGLGMIAFAYFLGATTLADQSALAVWSAVLLGISAGLYFWNKMAAKFFLGDSGAQTLGFLLASFGILYSPLERSPESSWIVPIMLLGVPIFDTTLVVLSRLRRRQAVGSGRRDHTYHRLIAMGFSARSAVFIVHAAAFVISFLAFLTLYLPPFPAILFFLLTLLCGIAALLWLERKPTLDEQPEGNGSA